MQKESLRKRHFQLKRFRQPTECSSEEEEFPREFPESPVPCMSTNTRPESPVSAAYKEAIRSVRLTTRPLRIFLPHLPCIPLQSFQLDCSKHDTNMQLFNLSVAIAFLFSSTSANPGGPSSALQHVRRDHQPDPPMAYTYIMKDAFEEVDEKLAIHRPDGKVACYFQKNTHDLRRGKSNTVVKDFSGVDLLILRSGDDLCGKHSHYVSPDGIVVIEIDPRGLQSDQWILKRQIPSGYANFLFKRHTTNKNGRIYDANGNLVAELLNEIRYEPWLDPGQKGTRTYSLRVTATAPNLELVTMMALVLSRTDACGL